MVLNVVVFVLNAENHYGQYMVNRVKIKMKVQESNILGMIISPLVKTKNDVIMQILQKVFNIFMQKR